MQTKKLIERLTGIVQSTKWKDDIPQDLEPLLTTVATIVQLQQLDIESLNREADDLRKMIQENN